MSGARPDRIDRLYPLASDRIISEATPVSVVTNVGQMIEFVKRSGAGDAGLIVDLHTHPASGVALPSDTDMRTWRSMAELLREEFPNARFLFGVHGVGAPAAAFLERSPPRREGVNRLTWRSNTRDHEIALFAADSSPVEVQLVVDLSRLEALLRLDERGEYIAEQLSRLLVDRRKRRLLLIQLHEIDQDRESRQEDTVLTQSEAEVLRIVMDARKPVTTAEVQDRATSDSLRKYRQHASRHPEQPDGQGSVGEGKGTGKADVLRAAPGGHHTGPYPTGSDARPLRPGKNKRDYGVAVRGHAGNRRGYEIPVRRNEGFE